MASNGNPNQPPFDVQRFFNPASSPPPISPNPNFQNPNNIISSAASYSTPTVTSGTYTYAPQTLIYHPMPPANLHHQRSVPYPTPPLQPNPNTNPNHGARLMALLSAPPPTAVDNPGPNLQPANPALTSSLVPALHSGPGSGSGPLRMPGSGPKHLNPQTLRRIRAPMDNNQGYVNRRRLSSSKSN